VQGWWADHIDTTYTNVYDYLRLYEADPDTPRRVGEDLKVHITVTPVSYYIKPDVTPISYLNPLPVFPMYECYFSTPVTVADSFYVGRTVRTGKPAPGNRKENFEIILFGLDILDQKKESYVLHQDMSMGSVHCQDPEYYEWCYVKNDAIGYPFIFPILTPNPMVQERIMMNCMIFSIRYAAENFAAAISLPRIGSGSSRSISVEK
jgi:hypothetical protein